MNGGPSGSSPELRRWQRRIFASVWITYFAFYLCRANMSVAKSPLKETFDWKDSDVGIVFTALTVMYAIGQFVNGQLADRFGTRLIATLGIVVSVLMNLAVFAVTFFAVPQTADPKLVLGAIALFWAVNGFFQAMGWSPMVRVMAHWFEKQRRGHVMGWLGTCYQFGGAFSWFLAIFLTGYAVQHWGSDWRAVFWVPAVLFAVVGVYFYWSIRNQPEDVGLPPVNVETHHDTAGLATAGPHVSIVRNVLRTLTNPLLWIVALSFLLLDVNRYGYMNWLPGYMKQAGGEPAGLSLAGSFMDAIKICVLPLAGSVGSVVAGWATDRFFGGRRAPVMVVLLVALGLLSILFPYVDPRNTAAITAVLALIGFCTYGPHILMVGHAAQDFGRKSGAAGAAGFIDGLGYIGASLAGWPVGVIIDRCGNTCAFVSLGVAALLGAALAAVIWRVKPT